MVEMEVQRDVLDGPGLVEMGKRQEEGSGLARKEGRKEGVGSQVESVEQKTTEMEGA